MHLPNLSLLGASLLLLPFQLVHAAGSIISEDHNHLRLQADGVLGGAAQEPLDSVVYEPNFPGLDRGIIGKRASDITTLDNNNPGQLDISPGQSQNWVFPSTTVFGPKSPATPGLPPTLWKRDQVEMMPARVVEDSKEENGEEEDWDERDVRKRQQQVQTLWITLNTCSQPTANVSGVSTPPQLQLYVSQVASNQKPGPGGPAGQQTTVPVTDGYANLTLNATGDVYIGVSAPAVSSSYSGNYHYEVAASIDAPYHGLNASNPNLLLIDTDSNSALLMTRNLTDADPVDDPAIYQQWQNLAPPFTMFAQNQNNSAINGLQNSYCGLKKNAQIIGGQNNTSINTSIITRGPDQLLKEQLYINGLNRSSSYTGILAMVGNSTAQGAGVVGGGGMVWQAMTFNTKSDGNCQIVFNLPFCSDVAYAVPVNPTNQSLVANLGITYDNNSQSYWQNFSNSLALTPCETDSSAQYSLARTCTDCAAAYKQWLCAVTMPRCADYSSTEPWLQARNVMAKFVNGSAPPPALDQQDLDNQNSAFGNQSRTSFVDQNIIPGPYKEVLPCVDLCYTLVQSCPAALQFTCPSPGKGLQYSYGQRSGDGNVTCSFPGAAYHLGGAARLGVDLWLFGLVAGLMLLQPRI